MSNLAGHVVFCKRLRNEGLQMCLGMAGYCVKYIGEENFEFVHHNVFANNMNEGKLEYAKLKNISLNNCVSLSHSNILQRAHQRACFCIKKTHRCYSLWQCISHVREWSNLPKSHMGYSYEICMYEC